MSGDANGLNDMEDYLDDLFDSDFKEYPYSGAFYTFGVDEDLPLDERVPQEILVEVVEHCDIQIITSRHQGNFLGAGYKIYYPLEPNPEWDGVNASEKWMPIKVRRGMTFRGGGPLYPTEGTVELVRFSQMGQASIYIKVGTESDI